MGILHRDRQTDPGHDRQIDHVVADVGDLPVAQAGRLLEFFVGREFVAFSLEHVLDAQAGHADPYDLGRASGDDGDLHPGLLQHDHAVPVLGVKRLVLLAVVTDEQTAVGEYAVDVENDQADALGLAIDVLHASFP